MKKNGNVINNFKNIRNQTDEDAQELINAAIEARKFAYVYVSKIEIMFFFFSFVYLVLYSFMNSIEYSNSKFFEKF